MFISPPYTLGYLLLGLALLLFGRRLFWFFIGAIGFLIGFNLTPQLFPSQSGTTVLIIALVVGVIAALLAIALQGAAISILGFLIGAYTVYILMRAFGLNFEALDWIFILFGGILGALFIALVFDWALVVFSSLAGASFITEALGVDRSIAPLALLGLFLIGAIVQAGLLRVFSRPPSPG